MDKALTEQEGLSEDIETKNHIRWSLKQFFRNRTCFSLVRPLEDEEKLQKLNEQEFTSLRPEFQNQVLLLRKMVYNDMFVKKINGKDISGYMLAGLINK